MHTVVVGFSVVVVALELVECGVVDSVVECVVVV